MDKFNFLKQIDELKEFIPEKKVIELYDSAEQLIECYEDEISELKQDVDDYQNKISSKNDFISELESELDDLRIDLKFELEGVHNNIITEEVIEKLFKNLDTIPIHELESFINKYTNS